VPEYLTMTFSDDLIWWITIVELPALTALAVLIWRNRLDAHRANSDTADRAKNMLDELRAELAGFKFDVARSYASVALLKDTEKRLTHHLLRIEAKLDSSVFQRAEDNLQLKG
tara:strand:+ start:3419 stop:3757 length:339 start_codon:yes stop_codon:yes gene_type:complete